MTLKLYAITVICIAVGVLIIYGVALAVFSEDVHTWKCERGYKARVVTYCLSFIIAAFCFAVWNS